MLILVTIPLTATNWLTRSAFNPLGVMWFLPKFPSKLT